MIDKLLNYEYNRTLIILMLFLIIFIVVVVVLLIIIGFIFSCSCKQSECATSYESFDESEHGSPRVRYI